MKRLDSCAEELHAPPVMPEAPASGFCDPGIQPNPHLDTTTVSGNGQFSASNRPFRFFLVGESVSLLGTQVSQLALPLTAIYLFNAGPGAVGLLRGAQLLPYLLFSLLLGVWIDRHRRRPLMITANVVRLVVTMAIPVLAALHRLHMPFVYVVAFVAGTGAVLFDLSCMSFVPTLVRGRKNLLEANGKIGIASYSAEAAGPALGGGLVAALTAPIAVAVDAASYAVSLVSLLLVRMPEPLPDRANRLPVLTELGEGLRFVFRGRYLRPLALVGAAFNFFSIATTSVFLVYAVKALHLSAAGVGGVLSVAAIAGIVGSFAARRLLGRFPLGTVYAASVSVAFLGPVSIPAAGGPRWLVVVMVVVACGLMSTGGAVANVVVLTMRQVSTPDRLLGRMNAGFRTALFGGGTLGGPVGGLLAATFGLRGGLWIITSGAALMVVPVLLSPITRLRHLPEAA